MPTSDQIPPSHRSATPSSRTSPRNYPGSCSQREPKRPKGDDVRSGNLRGVVCGSLALVSFQKGLITQRSLVQIQPPQPTKLRGYGTRRDPFGFLTQRSVARQRTAGSLTTLFLIWVRHRERVAAPPQQCRVLGGEGTRTISRVPNGGRRQSIPPQQAGETARADPELARPAVRRRDGRRRQSHPAASDRLEPR